MEAGAQIVLSTLQLVLAGIGIGVLMAAPIGPVNVLVIQRAVAGGFWAGLAAGIGAVLGDGLLAAIAAFSVTAISDAMSAYSGWIQVHWRSAADRLRPHAAVRQARSDHPGG